MLKSLIFLFLTIHHFSSNAQRPMTSEDKFAKYTTKFRGIECKSIDNTTIYFKFCYAKSYSRTISTLNFGIKTQKKLNSIYLRIVASFRYGNIYREVIDSKLVNFCQAMNGSSYNLFLKFIFDVIEKSIPGLLHKCPYEGDFDFKNITIDNQLAMKFSIFPEGQYKYNISILENSDKVMLMMVIFTEVKSPVKTSFG
ncbi:hypothetical protein ACKWTF_015522 [Chironomus riparius]